MRTRSQKDIERDLRLQEKIFPSKRQSISVSIWDLNASSVKRSETLKKWGFHLSFIVRSTNCRIGYMGAIPNRQYDYDHKSDQAIYLDKPLVDRKISVMRTSYEKHKKLAAVGMAGPAVMETFGEAIFMPTAKKEAFILSEKQQKLSVL